MEYKFFPRIKGRVYQSDLLLEMPDGEWFFELVILNYYYNDDQIAAFEPIGPFDTEAEAEEQLKTAVQLACEAAERHYGISPSRIN